MMAARSMVMMVMARVNEAQWNQRSRNLFSVAVAAASSNVFVTSSSSMMSNDIQCALMQHVPSSPFYTTRHSRLCKGKVTYTQGHFLSTNVATDSAISTETNDERVSKQEMAMMRARRQSSRRSSKISGNNAISYNDDDDDDDDDDGMSFRSIMSKYSERSRNSIHNSQRQVTTKPSQPPPSSSYGRHFKRHHEHVDATPEESLFWAKVSSLRSKRNKSFNVDMLLARLRNSTWRTTRHYNALMRSAPKPETPRIFIALRADKQIVPDEYSYFLLVEAYSSLGGMVEASNCVELLENSSTMKVNANIYNALLHGYARQGDVPNAMKTYESMRSQDMTLGVKTQNLLLMAHGKANMLDKMQELFEEMDDDSNNNDDDNNNHDDVNGGKRGEVSSSDLTKRTNGTYEIMLSCYAAAGNVSMARTIFDRMMAKGHTPRECHLTPMANAYVIAKDAEGAKAFLRELEDKNIPIHTNLFAIVLKALADQGNYKEVLSMIKRRSANQEHITTKIWSCLVQAYAVAGRMDMARRVVDDMISSKRLDCHPNVVTYTIMINGYGMVRSM